MALRAERRYGELLGPRKPGRRSDVEPLTAGKRLTGADHVAANQARKVWEVDEPVFEAYLADAEKPSRAD